MATKPKKGTASFGRDRRILKSGDFATILRVGARGATPHMNIAIVSARGVGRIGISASAKIGGSVQRNRARRLVREHYRQAFRSSAAHDIVVNLKHGFAELSAIQAGDALNDAFSKAIAAGKRVGRRAYPVH